MKFKDELINLDACQEAIEWVGDKTKQEAFETCERGDWMLWYIAKTNMVDIRTLVGIKIECASLVKHLMKHQRSLKALEVGERFSKGLASLEELKDAVDDAYTAYIEAHADAAYAAYAAAFAAAYAYVADFADSVADAANSVADAVNATKRKEVLKQCADIVRRYVKQIKK